MLAELLAGLRRQVRHGMTMRIVVIDNDRQRSASAVAETFRASSGIELVYDVEPEQNIALARNRALAHCHADYVAFIDDDELPSQAWLRTLLDCLRHYDADVAFGPVLSRLPDQVPPWMRDCFRKPDVATGAPVRFGGAGNVLLRRAALAARTLQFDPAFGLTGGEDTDLFYRLHLAGRRLVWCAEALASEAVPPARLQLSWQRRRAFRGGQTYYRVFVRRYSRGQSALWFATKSAQLLGAALAAPVLRCVNYRAFVALTLRMAGAAGQLSRCFSGENFEEYHVRHYQ
jgi:succinoglycan biosynthesis protein ExoM